MQVEVALLGWRHKEQTHKCYRVREGGGRPGGGGGGGGGERDTICSQGCRDMRYIAIYFMRYIAI